MKARRGQNVIVGWSRTEAITCRISKWAHTRRYTIGMFVYILYKIFLTASHIEITEFT